MCQVRLLNSWWSRRSKHRGKEFMWVSCPLKNPWWRFPFHYSLFLGLWPQLPHSVNLIEMHVLGLNLKVFHSVFGTYWMEALSLLKKGSREQWHSFSVLDLSLPASMKHPILHLHLLLHQPLSAISVVFLTASSHCHSRWFTFNGQMGKWHWNQAESAFWHLIESLVLQPTV